MIATQTKIPETNAILTLPLEPAVNAELRQDRCSSDEKGWKILLDVEHGCPHIFIYL